MKLGSWRNEIRSEYYSKGNTVVFAFDRERYTVEYTEWLEEQLKESKKEAQNILLDVLFYAPQNATAYNPSVFQLTQIENSIKTINQKLDQVEAKSKWHEARQNKAFERITALENKHPKEHPHNG